MSIPNYCDVKYWNKRYREQSKTTFDWLEDFESLKDYLLPLVSSESKVLIAGCGNSQLGELLYQKGTEKVFNVDFSESVIEIMSQAHRDKLRMKWEVMDVQSLSYPSEYFDLVLDKSTLDTLLCEVKPSAELALAQYFRVLRKDGKCLIVSFNEPETMLPLISQQTRAFTVTQTGSEAFPNYIYCLQKEAE